MPRRLVFDRWLFFTTGLLLAAGLLMVGSASQYAAMGLGREPLALLLQHAVYVVVGALAMTLTLSLPYTLLADRRIVYGGLALVTASLVAVFLMPEAGGAHRWIRLGPLQFQPSEFAKLVTVVFVAYRLSEQEERVNAVKGVLLPVLGLVGALALLVAIEPDLGTAVMLVVPVGVMLFVAGVRWSSIGAAAACGAFGFVAAVIAEPYRWTRIKTFLDPTADVQGSGFQLAQSLIAVGSGGFAGAGLGQGRQKAFYLPASHTDFIFSVVGEEIGFIGCFLLVSAFLIVFWRGMRAALSAPDRFGFYLALGLTSLIVLQALINMGVCLGLLPTKGLPLPLVSYGGSSLVASMIAIGVLLNVSQHAR